MEQRSTILLVEDSCDDVFLFKRALREVGQDYDVRVAGTGEEAIDYLQSACQGCGAPEHPVPRFIILDNKLPGLSGTKLLGWILEHPLCRVIPTVMLSGTGNPPEVQRAFDLGAHGYFVKPMSRGELTDLMKMIFHYWAQSKVPPVKEYEVTAPGEPPVLKAFRQ